MLFVKAQITIAAENREKFLPAMLELIRVSRAEDGCLSFECFEDIAFPGAFIILEEWRDQATFDQHEGSNHVAQFKATVGGLIVAREPTRVFAG